MKKIFFFSIPAHGHTNPMLAVARELTKRGNTVIFYSFNEFKEKIESVGAKFVSCDSFLAELTQGEKKRLKSVSTTEMTLQALRTTLLMDGFLDKEFKTHKPDVVFSDSVCFWGKLNAAKHKVPLVVSTSTFAFNNMSSRYLKHSARELFDLIFGLPKTSRMLHKLELCGYRIKNVLSLVESDNSTPSVVYTSRRFQPYAESFSDSYAFVGPSILCNSYPDKKTDRPLIYISLGTVINDRPDFYGRCIAALGNRDMDVIISCGKSADIKALGVLPGNIKVFSYVNQLDILSKANVFISHCGMNSVSEALYMAVPIILYPQTAEQHAVARRVTEINAGIELCDDSADGIAKAVLRLLSSTPHQLSAKACSQDFRSCSGASGAADFIEGASHITPTL